MGRAPNRGQGTWDEFLRVHAKTLWACDCFATRAITARGGAELYSLVFICLETREIFITTSTRKPGSVWVAQQARNSLNHVAGRETQPGYLIHDRDSKFTNEFDSTLRAAGVTPKRLPFRSPNLNARCERVVPTIQLECLDNLLIFGRQHLDYLIGGFADYYNTERAHSRRNHLPPLCADPPQQNERMSTIECHERLGGLIKSFERVAA